MVNWRGSLAMMASPFALSLSRSGALKISVAVKS